MHSRALRVASRGIRPTSAQSLAPVVTRITTLVGRRAERAFSTPSQSDADTTHSPKNVEAVGEGGVKAAEDNRVDLSALVGGLPLAGVSQKYYPMSYVRRQNSFVARLMLGLGCREFFGRREFFRESGMGAVQALQFVAEKLSEGRDGLRELEDVCDGRLIEHWGKAMEALEAAKCKVNIDVSPQYAQLDSLRVILGAHRGDQLGEGETLLPWWGQFVVGKAGDKPITFDHIDGVQRKGAVVQMDVVVGTLQKFQMNFDDRRQETIKVPPNHHSHHLHVLRFEMPLKKADTSQFGEVDRPQAPSRSPSLYELVTHMQMQQAGPWTLVDVNRVLQGNPVLNFPTPTDPQPQPAADTGSAVEEVPAGEGGAVHPLTALLDGEELVQYDGMAPGYVSRVLERASRRDAAASVTSSAPEDTPSPTPTATPERTYTKEAMHNSTQQQRQEDDNDDNDSHSGGTGIVSKLPPQFRRFHKKPAAAPAPPTPATHTPHQDRE
ncbi:unnamed protein product [Vitrella brassicaformis CCMP3155]|uniref:Uncharacterized protein n=1 Tax=Vitrella brassicaformis (strain CCMP3155) TaxID=1169540 RepID=A0A0G4EQS4_VITBC|nr:unnamed protein product [Vitrella brassicaformis CCMP3155]|mmetsp:Transcript_35161/g.87304  ORF Transcript_35161/g.87304 Transcript_35161/m.87304 type:complete len:494 (-) Transcript_35161:1484-2965(-)|eukprot:CEL99595.1 unnamed protein product [Vitrella brassicaformis CCMP3155]